MLRIFRTLFNIFWLPALILFLQYCRQWFLYGQSQFDPIAHFMGGFAIAYSALIVFKLLYPKLVIPSELLAFFLIASGVFVGVIWEWYEFIRFHDNPLLANWDWWPDTLFDLFMDMSGAIVYACSSMVRRKI